jgi:hypothetical protein
MVKVLVCGGQLTMPWDGFEALPQWPVTKRVDILAATTGHRLES